MGLSTEQQILIEQRVTNDSPSAGVAYLLWFFTWWAGGHRWYLGRPGTAILMIIATLFFIVPGAIWALVDAFLIPGMIRDMKHDLRQQLTLRMLATSAAPPATPAAAGA